MSAAPPPTSASIFVASRPFRTGPTATLKKIRPRARLRGSLSQTKTPRNHQEADAFGCSRGLSFCKAGVVRHAAGLDNTRRFGPATFASSCSRHKIRLEKQQSSDAGQKRANPDLLQ